MTDNELLTNILAELKNIAAILQDVRAGTEAQHELTSYKLASIEEFTEQTSNTLKIIENNTRKN